MTKLIPLAAALLILAACQAGPEMFGRPSTTPGTRAQDFAQCRYEVSFIWHPWQQSRALRACMLARGYYYT